MALQFHNLMNQPQPGDVLHIIKRPDRRANTLKYHCNGFLFHADPRNPNILRCVYRSGRGINCPGMLHVTRDNVLIRAQDHVGHLANEDAYQIELFKDECYRLCRETFDTFSVIFENVARQLPRAAMHLTLNSMKTTMKRERHLNVPPLPLTLEELGQILENYPPMANIYRGCARSADSGRALVFIHPSMDPVWEALTQLWGDGTWKGIVIGFCFTNCKSHPMYVSLFKFSCMLFPPLRENLPTGACDFELAVINALHIVSPMARVVACSFHYKQSILKRWKKLRLPLNEGTELLEICWAMAYLPAIMWPQGMGMVAQAAEELAARFPRAALMYDYWNRVWPRLANEASVFGVAVRTTNVCETFNKLAHALFGYHPPMFSYLDTMNQVMEKTERKYVAITRNNMVFSVRSQAEMQADVNLLRKQVGLYLGSVSVEDFLQFYINQRRLQYYPEHAAHVGDEPDLPHDVQVQKEMEFVRDMQGVFARAPAADKKLIWI
ncbi:hypothetical protein QAD02_000478 [Eretmocerus hayati]|uniref:Uncharacterized protein n=1 Tax=Eretmocerus hayati TaxID=131215 RepID=A0ACC2NDE4_9HYME|nr:hypothetical protein QAD02_000478 [Eretmocerus hayati]